MRGVPEITELLVRIREGDEAARQALFPLVYRELEAIARAYVRGGGRSSRAGSCTSCISGWPARRSMRATASTSTRSPRSRCGRSSSIARGAGSAAKRGGERA